MRCSTLVSICLTRKFRLKVCRDEEKKFYYIWPRLFEFDKKCFHHFYLNFLSCSLSFSLTFSLYMSLFHSLFHSLTFSVSLSRSLSLLLTQFFSPSFTHSLTFSLFLSFSLSFYLSPSSDNYFKTFNHCVIGLRVCHCQPLLPCLIFTTKAEAPKGRPLVGS